MTPTENNQVPLPAPYITEAMQKHILQPKEYPSMFTKVMTVITFFFVLAICFWLASMSRDIADIHALLKPIQLGATKGEIIVPKLPEPPKEVAPVQPKILVAFLDESAPPLSLFYILETGQLGPPSLLDDSKKRPTVFSKSFWKACDDIKDKLPDKKTLWLNLPGYGMQVDVVGRKIKFLPEGVQLPDDFRKFWAGIEANGKRK